jgi:hypothetical protein
MKMYEYDPADADLNRLLTNWSRQVPVPLDGKERLYYQVGHYVPQLPFSVRLLRTCLWLFHTFVVIPIDYLLTPLDYAVEDEIHMGLYHSRLDLSLAVRAMTNNTISHGVEIFTYIT